MKLVDLMPPKRVSFWLLFAVFVAFLPYGMTLFFLLAEGTITFAKAIGTYELAFFSLVIGAITIGDLLDFSEYIEKKLRIGFFVLVILIIFVNFFFFTILFLLKENPASIPYLMVIQKVGNVDIKVPKYMVSGPPFFMALVVFIGGLICQYGFAKLENGRQ